MRKIPPVITNIIIAVLMLCNIALAEIGFNYDIIHDEDFEVAASADILPLSILANNSVREILFPAIPAREGKAVVLRLQARLNINSNWGYNNNLGLKLNGRSVLPKTEEYYGRVLNRWDARFLSKNSLVINSSGRICVLHRNNFTVPVQVFNHIDEPQAFWYYIDVTDLISVDAGNTLLITNYALTQDFNGATEGQPEIIIGDCGLGYVDMELVNNAPLRSPSERQVAAGLEFEKGNYCLILLPEKKGFQVSANGENYFFESYFSYPYGGMNAFTCQGAGPQIIEPDWQAQIEQTDDGFKITASGQYYSMERQFICRDHAIQVKDKITNLTEGPLGMLIRNQSMSLNKPEDIYRNGLPLGEISYEGFHNDPAPNSTIFYQMENSGLGIAIEDDVYRLQCNYVLRINQDLASFTTEHFGLDAGKSYTLEWSIYPVASTDYFDFINIVRNDWQVNTTVDGGVCLSITVHFRNFNQVIDSDPDLVGRYLKHLNAKIIFLYWMYDTRQAWDENYSLEQEIIKWRTIADKIKAAAPGVKVIMMYQTTTNWRLTQGQPDIYADSVLIDPDGQPKYYGTTGQEGDNQYRVFRYVSLNNSYYEKIKETVAGLMDAGLDGMYFDTPNNIQTEYGRFTYDRWDGHTVDLDLNNYTITNQYTDCALLAEEAWCDMISYITGRGGIIVFNNPPISKNVQSMPGSVFHLSEGDFPRGLVRQHLTTPVILGERHIYVNGEPSAGPGYGRRETWETEEDLMDDIRWKLLNGLLYYTYGPPGEPYYPPALERGDIVSQVVMAHQWPLTKMFPTTIMDIHRGWIRGKERIITCISGEFSWGAPEKAILYSYNNKGKMLFSQFIRSSDEGKFNIEVPQDGMVILEKLGAGLLDVNQDSAVNVLDIQACVNHILGVQDWAETADINGDTVVDILDLQILVNAILEA